MTPDTSTDSAEILTFSGVIGSLTSGAMFRMNESSIMMTLTVAGLVISVVGLIYTIWKGERSYRLELRAFEESRNRKEDWDVN
jgi:hypothetical protein